jgi:hypothetical protein
MVVGSWFLSISQLKPNRFAKSYIYSERGSFGASSHIKNSVSIFFQKIGFSKRGLNIHAYIKEDKNQGHL